MSRVVGHQKIEKRKRKRKRKGVTIYFNYKKKETTY